jgi:GDP-L-fucose synthase
MTTCNCEHCACYWRGKNVVVTGGRGMVGSFLVDNLVGKGARVTVMDTGVRGRNHNPLAHYVDTRLADAGHQGNCGAAFRNADVVFNLAAAVGGVYHNLAHQAEQYAENMRLQTAPVLAAVEMGVPVFVQVSSVCVYATGYNNPALEEHGHEGEPEAANAGYAWAKRMGERLCHWAFEPTQTRYVIVRPTNIYGPRDYFDDRAHVIPALIRKFETQDHVQVYGGPQTREFIYAPDVAAGMIAAAEHGLRGDIINLGTGGDTQTTIAHLVDAIRKWTLSRATVEFVDTRPTGDAHRRTDSARAWALGWRHTVGLDEGIMRTVAWYREQQ